MPSTPSSDDIPATLLEYDQWLCWREETRDGKSTKIPIDPTTGEFASTTDPETWAPFETAQEQVQFGDEDGMGFVFTDDDPIVGVDLDDCRVPETGSVQEWAEDVVETLESYTEVSPSGTGLHVLLEGELPEGRNRHGDIEIYETARFFTVTGAHLDGTPEEIRERSTALRAVYNEHLAPEESESTETVSPSASTGVTETSLDDSALLEKARNAANGEKFQRLYRGDTSGYESHSEADMALCSLLAFWTGGDPRRVDRLFRDSGLMREKWDEQHYVDGSTYGEKTVERAIAGTSEFYDRREAAEGNGNQEPTPTVDIEQIRERDAERTERIQALENQLQSVLDENEHLKEELEAVRAERDELREELEVERDDGGLFSW